jgi:hypothetical protein
MAPTKANCPHCNVLLSRSQINHHLAEKHTLELQATMSDYSNDSDVSQGKYQISTFHESQGLTSLNYLIGNANGLLTHEVEHPDPYHNGDTPYASDLKPDSPMINDNPNILLDDNDWFEPYDDDNDSDSEPDPAKQDQMPTPTPDTENDTNDDDWESELNVGLDKMERDNEASEMHAFGMSQSFLQISILIHGMCTHTDQDYLTDADLDNVKAFSMKLSRHLSQATHSKI